MRVVALVESEDHVCCRYRWRRSAIRSPRPGTPSTFDPYPALPSAASPSAAIYPTPTPSSFSASYSRGGRSHLLRRRVRRLIFDFDDAVWLRDSYSPQGFDDPKRAAAVPGDGRGVRSGRRRATTSSRPKPRRYTSPERVVVIPTCVEPAKYPVTAPHTSRQRLQLVWVGSPEHAPRTGAIHANALRDRPSRSRHAAQADLRSVPDDPRPAGRSSACGAKTTEAAEIAAADVGISWVPDDPWSRGKCGLKVLQYQAAGLPVVANPVGVQAEMVRNGDDRVSRDDDRGMGRGCRATRGRSGVTPATRPRGAAAGGGTLQRRGRARRWVDGSGATRPNRCGSRGKFAL